MNNRWLILDATFLAHRAKHATGNLSYKGSATGVVYGFLKDVLSLQEQFQTNNVIFCWDSKHSKRRDVYPEYKANRRHKDLTPEEWKFEKQFRYQIKMLRKKYLQMIGYRNVLFQKGYEADDLIAISKSWLLDSLLRFTDIIIVTCDHDLYQLLGKCVRIYNPNTGKTITADTFRKEYEIEPRMWTAVKAIGGCSTDNVKGLKGVAEKTAIKILRKQLPAKSKAMTAFNSKQGKKIIIRNFPLVTLPYPGTKSVRLRTNKLSVEGWRMVCKILGFKSLRDRPFPKVPE